MSAKESIARLLERVYILVQYNPTNRILRTKLRNVAASVSGDILDIGAGTAPYKHLFLNSKSYKSTNTRRHYGKDDLKMQAYTDFWIEDGTSLPFPDASFDAVCMFSVLSVISEPKKQFSEISRVLKPNGKLFLSSDFLYPAWSSEDQQHFTKAGLRMIAEDKDLNVHRLESFGGFYTMWYMLTQHYFRNYPATARSFSPPLTILLLLFIPIIILLSAIASIVSWPVILVETELVKNSDYAYHTYLEAEKTEID